jgi:hypothetical protein
VSAEVKKQPKRRIGKRTYRFSQKEVVVFGFNTQILEYRV